MLLGGSAEAATLQIEAVADAHAGFVTEVSVAFQNPAPALELGAFTLLIQHHPLLILQSAAMGQTLQDCEWEHFTYNQQSSNRIEIFAVADIANGPHHPSCQAIASGEVVTLIFTVSMSLPLDEQFLPIEWIWYGCGDNSLSSTDGSTLFISDSVYSFDGTSYTNITASSTFPTLTGAPAQCSGGVRQVDFYCGGVHAWSIDTEPPVAECPGNITVGNDPGLCSAVVTYAATVSDNRPGATIYCDPPSGSDFSLGQTQVFCYADDMAGNADTCDFIVTVNDTEYPQLQCPNNILTNAAPGECGAVVTFDPVGTDNCLGTSVVTFPSSGSFFEVGITDVAVILTDAGGNYDGCFFEVIVIDNQKPVVDCPSDITVDNDPGECGAVVMFAIDVADNCSDVQASSIPASGSFFGIGTTSVEIVAVDLAGNADTCWFNVTVNDTEPPTVSCPADIEVLNDFGQYGAVVEYEVSASDNCPGVTMDIDPPSGSMFDVGTTPVQFIATDESMLADTCTFTVTVLLNDPDNDGFPDWDDNCPNIPNHEQEDTDEDGIGDVCDKCTDTDDDGYGDPGFVANSCPQDNCPDDFNPFQSDVDCDGIGDVCDECTDTDNDGYGNPGFPQNICPTDNCPDVPNPEQNDTDSDQIGDACDSCTDTDGDGFGDPGFAANTCPQDNCPDDFNPSQTDSDNDGTGDACCCLPSTVGDMDQSGQPVPFNVDGGDLSIMIDLLFISLDPIGCPQEGDINLSGHPEPQQSDIDGADLSLMIDHLFISLNPLPPCP